MKETDKAVIQFLRYRVSEISYTCPVTLEFPSDAKISCNMNFSKALGRISETRVQEKLRVNYGIRLAIKIRIIKYLSRLMDSLKSTSTGILHGKPICWQYFFRI